MIDVRLSHPSGTRHLSRLPMTAPIFQEQIACMPYSNKLGYVADDGHAASFAYERLHVHRAAAAKQVDRIEQALAAQAALGLLEPKLQPLPLDMALQAEVHQRSYAPAFAEMHFYFVCWSCIRHMTEVITAPPHFVNARKAFSGHTKHFDNYDGARNSFEHFEQRLPGGKGEGRVKEVVQGAGASPSKIFFGYSDGRYLHSNREWDVTRSSLAILNNAIDETLSVLHQLVDSEVAKRFPRA
jgi:hypothetical protein